MHRTKTVIPALRSSVVGADGSGNSSALLPNRRFEHQSRQSSPPVCTIFLWGSQLLSKPISQRLDFIRRRSPASITLKKGCLHSSNNSRKSLVIRELKGRESSAKSKVIRFVRFLSHPPTNAKSYGLCSWSMATAWNAGPRRISRCLNQWLISI